MYQNYHYAQLVTSLDRRLRRKKVRWRLFYNHHYFYNPLLAAWAGRMWKHALSDPQNLLD